MLGCGLMPFVPVVVGQDTPGESGTPAADSSEATSSDNAQTTTTTASETTDTNKPQDDKSSQKQENTSSDSDFDPSNEDWGSYYDPQNIFCGNFDCYKILGFDYETYSYEGKVPDRKLITKRYRQLSREWHPDKSKHKHAKQRFVKIARAYEVLTSKSLRQEYDALRYDQEAYFNKYGTSVLWSYAPKSDVTMVLLLLLIIGNVFSWFSQKHRWKLVANRLVRAALEDWTVSQGGSPESKQLRQEALEELAKREKADETSSSSSPSKANSSKKSKKSLSGKEKRRQEQEQLLPILKEMVSHMHDFGGGFHQPTWRDLLIVSLAKLPYKIGKELWWFTKYYVRRWRKLPLSDEERTELTRRAVGPLVWETSSEEDRDALIKRELWVVSNLAEWSEEQEFNKLSAWEKKEYMKLKKKGIVPDKDD